MLRFLVLCCSLLILASCANLKNRYGSHSLRSVLLCNDPNVDPTLLVDQLAERKQFPGIAVAVAYGENRIWSHGFGFAEIASESLIRPNTTTFRIGSTSKSLTAFLLARLAEQERIDLDQSVRLTLPDLPVAYENVTLRQLAGHPAGPSIMRVRQS